MGNKQSAERYDVDSNAVQEYGAYSLVYLGSCPVNRSKDQNTVLEAAGRIQSARHPKRKVILRITYQGLEVTDSKTGQQLTMTPMRAFSYISILGKKQNFIAYVETDRTNSIRQCHLFRSKKTCKEVSAKVNEAFRDIATDKNKLNRSRSGALPHTSLADSVDFGPPLHLRCKYLGHTTVKQSGGANTVLEAVRLTRRLNRPQTVQFELAGDVISLVPADGEPQRVLVSEITFTHVRKKLLAFITEDSQQVTFCHSFRMRKRRQAADANEAIGRALVTVANAHKHVHDGAQPSTQGRAYARHLTHSALANGNHARQGPLGLFEAQYLGSVPVDRNKSQATCDAAAESVLLMKPQPQVVAISVSGDGIKVVEALTSEVVSNTFIKNIAFTTVIEDKRILRREKRKGINTDDALFAFIIKDERLDRLSCEIFRAGTRAYDLCQSVNVAFQVAMEEAKQNRGKKHAFSAVSQKRDPVKGPLFQRQIHRRDLKPIRVLGMGQFGEVYLGLQAVKAGHGENGSNTIHRAVKLLKDGATPADREEFLRESELMLNFNHVNLVRLVGVAVQQRPWLCVLEYMEYGDLRAVVKAAHEKNITLTLLEQLKFAVQIATGMDYMAKHRFVHMDLAARNVLLSSKNLVKIADFGLSRKLPEERDVFVLTTSLKLPIKWMAIECMDEKIFSPASDCWALGVTMWEVAAYGMVPYPGVKNIEVQKRVREGLRLTAPEGCDPEFFELMCSCWERQPSQRPTFDQLRKSILGLAREARSRCPALRDVGRLVKGGGTGTAAATPSSSRSTTPKPSLRRLNTISDDPDFTEAGPKEHVVVGLPETMYDSAKTTRFVKVKPNTTVDDVDVDAIEPASHNVDSDASSAPKPSRTAAQPARDDGVSIESEAPESLPEPQVAEPDVEAAALASAPVIVIPPPPPKEEHHDSHDEGVDSNGDAPEETTEPGPGPNASHARTHSSSTTSSSSTPAEAQQGRDDRVAVTNGWAGDDDSEEETEAEAEEEADDLATRKRPEDGELAELPSQRQETMAVDSRMLDFSFAHVARAWGDADDTIAPAMF